ncbi:MAG: hypothetical protein Q4P33_04935 [Flaviflexus sp.]|nr:hypothetical protein [Flaviflexus sp.]
MIATILADGVQVSVALITIPFLLFAGADLSAEGTIAVAPLAVGLALGALGSWLVERLTVRLPPARILQVIEAAQILAVGWLIVAASLGHVLVVQACLAAALARMSGPAKDAVRAAIITPERRPGLGRTMGRVFFLATEVSIALATVIITLVPRDQRYLPLLLALGASAAGIMSSWSLRCPAGGPGARRTGPRHHGRRGLAQLAVPFLLVIVLGLGSGLPTVGLAAWITRWEAVPAWTISVMSLACLTAYLLLIRVLDSRMRSVPGTLAHLHRLGSLLLAAGLIGTWCAVRYIAAPAGLFLLAASLISSALAFSIAALIALELPARCGVSPRAVRAALGLATAAGALVAPGIFLGGGHIFAVALFLAVALPLLPPAATGLPGREGHPREVRPGQHSSC